MSGRHSPRRVLRAAILLAAGWGATPLLAQENLTVDVAASGGVATNPFLREGDTPLTGSATIEVSPAYVIDSPLTRIELRGDASVTQYFSDYGTNDSYSLNGFGTHRLSERSTLTARLGYFNSVVGAFNDLGVIGGNVVIPGVTPGLPTTPTDPAAPIFVDPAPPIGGILPGVITDPSLGGLGRRRISYQIGTGFQTQLGPRDRFYTDTSVVASRFGGSFDEYNYVAQHVGYGRTISDKLEVTADVQVGLTNYLRQRFGDATTYQPSIGVNYRLTPRTQLSVNAGAAIVRVDDRGGTSTNTSFNGMASLCRQDTRWNACLSASRATVPSAFEGVRTQDAIALSLGARLSERDSLALSTSYSRVGSAIGDVEVPGFVNDNSKYISVRGDFNRILSPRLSGFVSGGVARGWGDGFAPDANVEARVGVRYRFGADR